LDYASWTHAVLAGIEPSVAALDHWDRAAESIVENLANGNSRHAAADRNRYFDVAFGSALECAACLDICVCKKLQGSEFRGGGLLRPLIRVSCAFSVDAAVSLVIDSKRFERSEALCIIDGDGVCHAPALTADLCLPTSVFRSLSSDC
jgi:hypothetical protein